MKGQHIRHILILLVATAGVFAINFAWGGTIASPDALAEALGAPNEAPEQWRAHDEVPFRYRFLFRWLVQHVWWALPMAHTQHTFWLVYCGISFVALWATAVGIYAWLRILKFGEWFALVGGMMFFACPPVTYAYLFPVWTREEPLAYLVLVAAMIAMVQQRVRLLGLLVVLGTMTRETLMILPAVFATAGRGSFAAKATLLGLGFVTLVVLRALLGYESYNPFAGARRNFEYPVESAVFLFSVFGMFWLPAFAGYWNLARKSPRPLDDAWNLVVKSAPVAMLLIVGTHLLLARAREIRISFLLFPWMIPLALDWLRANVSTLRGLFRSPRTWLTAAALSAFLGSLLIYIRLEQPAVMALFAAYFNRTWLPLGLLHLVVTVAWLVPAWRQSNSHAGSLVDVRATKGA